MIEIGELVTKIENKMARYKRASNKEEEITNKCNVEAMLAKRIEEEIEKLKNKDEDGIKSERNISKENSAEIEKKKQVLSCQNNIHLFQLQKEEMIGEHLRRKTRVLEEKLEK